jgi:hypothetical protein
MYPKLARPYGRATFHRNILISVRAERFKDRFNRGYGACHLREYVGVSAVP